MATGNNPEDYEDKHGGYDYGVRKKGKVFMSFVKLWTWQQEILSEIFWLSHLKTQGMKVFSN